MSELKRILTTPLPQLGSEALDAVGDGADEIHRRTEQVLRHAANDADHIKHDLLLKVNPNATILDRVGTAVSHGVDNAKVAAQDAYDWAELNPGKAAGIALGVPVALAGSYYLYKKMKDRQNGGR